MPVAIDCRLDLHGAEDPAEGGVERIFGRLELDRLVGEAERRHVLLVDEEVRRVGDRLDLVRGHHDDLRRPGEREALPEPLTGDRFADLRESRAAAADVDPTRQQIAAAELLHDELDSRCPDLDVVGDDLGDLVPSLDADAPGVVDLQRFGPREREIEPIGEGLRERAPAEREHPRALDAAGSDQGDVGRPAAHVDEQGAGLADRLGAEDAGDGVRLGHDFEQLEIQL